MKLHFDDSFLPLEDVFNDFEKEANIPFAITIEQKENLSYTYEMKVKDDPVLSYPLIKKMVLSLLWMVGGDKIILSRDEKTASYFFSHFPFDPEFQKSKEALEDIFLHPLVLAYAPIPPLKKETKVTLGMKMSGSRIGFDAGGSDFKVTALEEGKPVFSKETLWHPKEESDYHYHYQEIKEGLLEAASHLKKVDAIGVSTSGIVLDNQLVLPTLMREVKKEERDTYIRPIYLRIRDELFPHVPITVLNDGDVSALGAYEYFQKNMVLGLAFGTSLAAGYCKDSTLNSWFLELGKVPLDCSPSSPCHESMGIQGSASEYLSQKGIIRLAKKAGYSFKGSLPLQLVEIQKEADKGNPKILACYQDMGIYLGEALLFFHRFLDFEPVFCLGRVMSGKGGDVLLESAKTFLKEKQMKMDLFTADEKFKRLGQSAIAATLEEKK